MIDEELIEEPLPWEFNTYTEWVHYLQSKLHEKDLKIKTIEYSLDEYDAERITAGEVIGTCRRVIPKDES